MDELELPIGLTIFSGVPNIGKSRFVLKWANHLAKKQKVLYLSWSSFEERHILTLKEMGDDLHQNLQIDSEYEFLDANSFIEIFDRIDSEKIDVVFFDDIHNTIYNHYSDNYFADQSAIVNSLLFISRRLKTKVVLVTSPDHIYETADIHNAHLLRACRFPRDIINKSHQIYFLYRPNVLGFETDCYGVSTMNQIQIHSLKNKGNKEFTIHLDNQKLNIYSSNKPELNSKYY